jgi:hypothetical protein
LLLVALAVTAPARADTIIASERAPSKISAELNRAVWSSYDPAAGDYHLMSRDASGSVTQLPIAPRKVPFDVDLGYLGEGREVATYSRCQQEPAITGGGSGGLLPNWATGRGCDIYFFPFDGPHELKHQASTRGASEFLPTVSPAGRIAFARVYERRRGIRGRLPYLYAKRGSHSLRRLPGGPRGLTGLPGPTSLDLSGPRLAFGWDWAPRTRGIRASTVRVDVARGSHRTLDTIIGGLIGRTLFSPSIVVRDVLWGRTILNEGSGGSSDFRYDPASGRRILTAPASPFMVSAAGVPGRGGIYYIATKSPSGSGGLGRPPLCGALPPPPLDAVAVPSTCTVARTGALSFKR